MPARRTGDAAIAGPVHSASSLRKLGLLGVVSISCAILALRAYLMPIIPAGDLAAIIRMALPCGVLAATFILLISFLFWRQKSLFIKLSSRSTSMAAFVFLFSLAECCLDVVVGLEPYLFIPGLAMYGFMAWSRPKLLAVNAVAFSAAVAALSATVGNGISVEDASILFLGLMLAIFGADVVKKNVMPSEERMKSLEAENKELWNLSYRDTLTGLFNRRYIEQRSVHLVARSARHREGLHVFMLDIDHFKRVNDKLGHAVGDEVLKGIAETIQSQVRSTDIVARYGGEEFIVYLIQSTPEITQYIANRIRDSVASMRFAQVPWTITISIGVAGLQEGDTVETLEERADTYLYTSKHHGRNRVSGF